MISEISFKIKVLSTNLKKQIDNCLSLRTNSNMTALGSWIIAYIYHNENRDVYQKDIEKEFNIKASSATEIIKCLEQNGYVIRQVSSKDNRLKMLKITEEAKKFHLNIVSDIKEIENKMLKGLSLEQIASLEDGLDKVINNIKNIKNKTGE